MRSEEPDVDPNRASNDEVSLGAENSNVADEPIQLYRPANSSDQVDRLLSFQHDWSDEEITSFLSGDDLPAAPVSHRQTPDEHTPIEDQMRRDYQQRRTELRKLSEQLKHGQARIDEDGRLVPTEPPRPPHANLPPPPPPDWINPMNMGLDWQEHHNNGLAAGGNPAVPPPNLLAPGALHGVFFDDGAMPPPANLTFRRICFAVLAVVTAFVCVILQTLPLMQPSEAIDPNFDQLLHKLLHVRFPRQHLRYCPGLHRKSHSLQEEDRYSSHHWKQRVWQSLGFYSETNCDDGVLHIPAKHVLATDYLHSSPVEATRLKPYRSGVDLLWSIPCHAPPEEMEGRALPIVSRCYPGWKDTNTSTADVLSTNKDKGECANTNSSHIDINRCFRGVHDGILSQDEVDKALRLGSSLILSGGDHFDVHYEVSHLHQQIPSVVDKLRILLAERYQQQGNLRPVAFRIHTAGPMDLHGVNLYQTPALTLNQTNYLDWAEKCKRQNELAQYSLPWPFRVLPIRDTCELMADLEADSRFAIHTSVFLADGAGMDYRGGVTLYTDNHWTNGKPKHRVRRGITIDGSKGRIVVSSGGIENRRCKFPTRAGLRTVLQIWWDCGE